MSVPFKILNAANPDFQGDLYAELRTLYAGGYAVEAAAKQFLPKAINEPQARYEERLKACGYINYLAEVTDSFVSQVFAAPLAMVPAADADDPTTAGTLPTEDDYYKQLSADADLSGTPFSGLLHKLLTAALIAGKAYALIDFPAPTADEPPVNLAEEDARGAARAYIVELPVESIISWSKDDHDRFRWCIVKKVIPVRESPLDPPGMQKVQFKVWERSNVISWRLFETPVHPANKLPKDTDEVPLVAEGTVSFSEIPIVEMCIPIGLWVGNKIGPLVREHFSRRSSLVSAENKSLYAIPVVYLGPEMSASGEALPAEAQQNPNRGHDGPSAALKAAGFMLLGKDDEVEFAEPTGGSYSIVNDQLKELVDEIHRVVHMMAASVSSTANAVGRSGDSKALDKGATDIVVDALAALVKAYAKRLFTLVSQARGESVVWDAQGLDRTEYTDRSQLLQEALGVGNLDIPSPTFAKTYKTKLALALVPKIDPQTANVIRDEIADAIDNAPHPEPGDEEPDDDDQGEPDDEVKDEPPSKDDDEAP